MLKEPITVASNEDNGIKILDYSLGLEVGKSYRLSGTYGANNAVFEPIIECPADSDGLCILTWYFPGGDSPEAGIYVLDKFTLNEDEEEVYDENSAYVSISVIETLQPLTLNSITLVEEAS